MGKLHTAISAAIVTAMAASTPAMADFSFPAFSLGGNIASLTSWENRLLNSSVTIPAGTYTGYRVVMNWASNFQGTSSIYAQSIDVRVAFASGQAQGGSTFLSYTVGDTQYSDIGIPINGAFSANNVTDLTIEGDFLTPYTSGPLWWNYRHIVTPRSNFVTWSNIRITLVPAPTTGVVVAAGVALVMRRRRSV